MIMTPRAFRGHAKKCRRRRVHKIFQTLILVVFGVIGLIVPCAEAEKTCRDHGLLRTVCDFIACQLVADELVIRHVAVERIDDPVTVLPGEWLHLIAFVSAGLCKSNNIQPMASPAFSKLRRVEQLVNQVFNGSRILLAVTESMELAITGREPCDIPIEPSNQSRDLGRRCGGQSMCRQRTADKLVDGIGIAW